MKIVLIFGSPFRHGFPALGIAYLASYAKSKMEGLEFKIFDQIPSVAEILAEKPDLVGFSGMTVHYPYIYKSASELRKEYAGPMIIGGIHVTIERKLPEFFDIGVIGEGEVTFLELLQSFRMHNGFSTDELKKIDGLIFHDNDELVQTKSRERIKDLDTLPFPDRDLYDMNYYLQPNNIFSDRIGVGTTLVTSRGCAYQCDFCSTTLFWGRPPRYHSAEYVVNELQHLIDKYKIELIYIEDDNFSSNLSRLRKIADEIEKRNIKLEMGICGRVDFFNDEIAELYRRIGVKSLSVGIETGNQRILSQIKNGLKLSVDEVGEQVRKMHAKGFEISGMFMIGNPTETEEEILNTRKFIKSLPLKKIHVHVALPYLGTKWWDIAVQQGIVPESPDAKFWETYDAKLMEPGRPVFTNTVERQRLYELWQLFDEDRKSYFVFDWLAALKKEQV